MQRQLYKHCSRAFHDVYNPLVTAYPHVPDDLFIQFAGFFETGSELINVISSDIMQPKTRESAYFFARANSYDPLEADGCTAEVSIKLKSAMDKTIPAGYQVAGISSSSGELVIFELTESASSGGSDVITAQVKQKETHTQIVLGTIDKQVDFYEMPIQGYDNIIKETVQLTIGGQLWDRVNNFDNSSSDSRHFLVVFQSNGKAFIRFGDGTTGLCSFFGETVYATFATTKGLNGILAKGEISINQGNDTDIQSITNVEKTSGGNNAESVDSIVRNASANNRLREIIWSEEDLEVAAMQSSSSVVKAFGLGGAGNATVYIIPANGGIPSPDLKSSVKMYMQKLTQFGKMPLSVLDPRYTTVDIEYSVTARSGYDVTTVRHLVKFALTLASCAFDNQVIDFYNDYGIDSCRQNLINVIWSWSFTQNDNDALAYIIKYWVTLLGDRDYREWGQPLEVGDLWVLGNELRTYGADIFNLITPTTNIETHSLNPDLYIINTGSVNRV